jgi:D-serine deaminase-like pyridoxal phosphate-dependent protein
MKSPYAIDDTSHIYSPGLLFYKDLIERNIAQAVKMVGDASRLRPHVKTHKTPEIVRLELAAGVTKHKCATLAEAEMLAMAGAGDVLIAYNMVGPNCLRLARLIAAYPKCRFAVTADHPLGVEQLSRVMQSEGQRVDVLLDIDIGQHRTGIAPGPEAVTLYEKIHRTPGVIAGGLHVYDGHNHQESLAERESAVRSQFDPVLAMRTTLDLKKLPVPRVVVGGTPTFPVWAHIDLPGLECSPGTCVLHDHGYGSRFTDMSGFTPAALLLTRVISRPTSARVTFDLGYKAVASDPPAGKRCMLLDVPEYTPILQNEEHFVIETPAADRFVPGMEALAVPTHICPTVAMHQRAYAIEGGRFAGTWDIVGRDRMLTV